MQSQNSILFREYIQGKDVRFTDVPINREVKFHFILAFALDTSDTPSTNGNFKILWDKVNLSPDQVFSIKKDHSNVKVALSLGGDSGRNSFSPTSTDLWVPNAVSSLKGIIGKYKLDGIDIGIDIHYDRFNADADTDIFAECMGQLIKTLKTDGVISFASIAPFDDDLVQSNYLALWKKYKNQIDYVNFRFYKYPKTNDTQLFLSHFKTQSTYYDGGKVLVSFSSNWSGGLVPAEKFFDACTTLKNQQNLHGIFVWSADISKAQPYPFDDERKAQLLLADASD